MNPPASVAPDSVKFNVCSLESDKFITACENVGGVQQIAIVDLLAGNSITRQKISAEAAIMNPVSKVIALRGKRTCYFVLVSVCIKGSDCYLYL